jgi:hypothetical protein
MYHEAKLGMLVLTISAMIGSDGIMCVPEWIVYVSIVHHADEKKSLEGSN